MLLGAALVLIGSAVLYYAVTGRDPRDLLAAGHSVDPALRPSGAAGGAALQTGGGPA